MRPLAVRIPERAHGQPARKEPASLVAFFATDVPIQRPWRIGRLSASVRQSHENGYHGLSGPFRTRRQVVCQTCTAS